MFLFGREEGLFVFCYCCFFVFLLLCFLLLLLFCCNIVSLIYTLEIEQLFTDLFCKWLFSFNELF